MINHKPNELKPTLWVEILFFLSAYYPLFLILFIRDLNPEKKGIQFGLDIWELNISWWAISFLIVSSLAIIIVGPLMRSLLKYQQGGTPIKVKSVEHIRGDMLNYTLPFLIGLFAFDYNSLQSILSLFIFLTFMFSFIHKEQISLLNPMFLLMGIRLFKIIYKEIGRTPEYEKNVLCLGLVKASENKIEIVETAGIHFIFPNLKCKE